MKAGQKVLLLPPMIHGSYVKRVLVGMDVT